MAAQFATPEAVNFMAKEARGLICLALTAERCEQARPEADGGQERGAASDRFHGRDRGCRRESAPGSPPTTARTRSRSRSTPIRVRGTWSSPASCLPAARQGRRGAGGAPGTPRPASTLARLAGLDPGRRDLRGDERRRDDVAGPRSRPLLRAPRAEMITVADLIAYRRRTEKLVERVVSTKLPTAYGEFTAFGYRSLIDEKHHVAMVKGDVNGAEDVLVRVHSECLTGDVFHSLRCDCGEQLAAALAQIEREGQGVCSTSPRRGGGSACSTSCAPTGCRRTGSTPSRPTSSSACPPTCATTGSGPRSSATSASPASASSPTTRRRSSGWRATGSRSPSRSRSRPSPTAQRGLPARQARPPRPHPAPSGAGPRRGADPRRAPGEDATPKEADG